MRDRDLISDKPVDPTRFWCAYTELEEYHAGMWKPIRGEKQQLKQIALAVSLLRSPKQFRKTLERVFNEWPTSCLAEFTSPGNHLAWMGQAACCIEHGVSEEMTRRAWWKLSEAERIEANRVAKEGLIEWKKRKEKNYRVIGALIPSWKNITLVCGKESPVQRKENGGLE